MNGIGFIYVFLDQAGEVVYVGQTRAPIHERHKAHMKSASPNGHPFAAWLACELEAGRVPQLRVIEEVAYDLLTERERHWIAHYSRLRGPRLMNVNDVPRENFPEPPTARKVVRACKSCGLPRFLWLDDETPHCDHCATGYLKTVNNDAMRAKLLMARGEEPWPEKPKTWQDVVGCWRRHVFGPRDEDFIVSRDVTTGPFGVRCGWGYFKRSAGEWDLEYGEPAGPIRTAEALAQSTDEGERACLWIRAVAWSLESECARLCAPDPPVIDELTALLADSPVPEDIYFHTVKHTLPRVSESVPLTSEALLHVDSFVRHVCAVRAVVFGVSRIVTLTRHRSDWAPATGVSWHP